MKKKLSKEALNDKAQAYLKDSGSDSCLATEDGTIFTAENDRYAISHARNLQKRQDEKFEGKVVEIDVDKSWKAKGKSDKKTDDKTDKTDDKKSDDKK